MNDLDAALNKAVEQATQEPATDTPAASTDAPVKESPGADEEVQTKAAAAPAAKDTKADAKASKSSWDGNVESLPEELREHAKAVQRYTTRIAQEAADARKKAEEYEKRFPQDKVTQYERWVQEQSRPKPGEAPRITQEEWEDALLDPTGGKVNEIIDRQIQFKVEAARKAYMSEATKYEREQQERKALEDRVLEFSQLNPDFEKLAKAGIMMPMLRDELDRGGSLETAYARAKDLVESLKGQRDLELKELAEKKKSASTIDKSNGHDETVKWVDNQDEALEASIEAAIAKRPVKVKVRPRKV